MQDIFIVGAKRTPIGAFQGALATVTAPELGAHALRGAIEQCAAPLPSIDGIWMGNVLTAGVGQAPARQAAKAAGIGDATPTVTVGKVCGSGMESVIAATRALLLGDACIVAAGGMESMSLAPYLLTKARSGYRLGHGELIDAMMHDGLWDPYNQFAMGYAGELCAREYGFSREAQDDFAERSYRRAQHAQKQGLVDRELVPLEVKAKKSVTQVSQDEEPGRANLEKMRSLRPAFDPQGTVTAANSSKINDGAAALILTNATGARMVPGKPVARILAYAAHAQEPERFTTAPIGAIRKALENAELTPQEIDLWEVNEAFAVVAMAASKQLDLDEERLNVHGGAVALGHPIGASGARILVTLVHALHARHAQRGVAAICIGGGEALAVVVERLD